MEVLLCCACRATAGGVGFRWGHCFFTVLLDGLTNGSDCFFVTSHMALDFC